MPAYLSEMLEPRSDNPALHRLRNTANRGPGKLVVPRSRLKTFGPRNFATTGPSLWNSLPTEVTNETLNISTFKIRLETFLFKQSSQTNGDIIPAARAPLRWPCYKETLYKCPIHYITTTFCWRRDVLL